MKHFFALLIFSVLFCANANAQKLVIGSKVSDHKEVESTQWKNKVKDPQSVWIIDFFSTANPTSVEFYNNHLPSIAEKIGDGAEVVIVTTKETDEFKAIFEQDKDKYAFAVDPKGGLFKLFGVQYLPFTVIVDHKGKILWQGNLSKLDEEIIKDVL